MVYNQRFVISLLVNGQIQPELNDGTVELPFGVEYAIKLRNKHKDRRAVCKLFIDGEEQSKMGYVIQPNSFAIIQRNSFSPRKFKFVAPDSTDAQDFGKDKNNSERLNGIIEGRFYLEKEQPKTEIHHHHHYGTPRPYHPWEKYKMHRSAMPCSTLGMEGAAADADMSDGTKCGGVSGSSTRGGPASFGFTSSSAPAPTCATNYSGELEACRSIAKSGTVRDTVAGVTVEGSYSDQVFRKVSIDVEDQFVSVKLAMRGYVGNTVEGLAEMVGGIQDGLIAIKNEVVYCTACGAKRSTSTANFCHICGHKF